MSEKYRLMIYFAVATLHLYRGSIRECATETRFFIDNASVIKRVCEEALSFFAYELSSEQIGRAVVAYLADAQRVEDTEAATL